MSERLLERRPEVALAAVTFLWGSTFVVTKDVVRVVAPLPYVCLRFGVATALLLAIASRARAGAPLRARLPLLRDGAILGVGQGGGLLLQVFAQLDTTASKAAFVTSLSTALTPLLGYALYRSRPRTAQAAGAALATFGLLLLTFPGAGAAWNRGDLLAAGCAVVYALVIVETARRAPHHDVIALTTVQTGTAFALFGLVFGIARAIAPHASPEIAIGASRSPELLSLAARPLDVGALGGRALVELGYMAVVCTVLTFLAQTWAMRRMSATHAAVVFALEPVFATLLAVAVEGASEWPGVRGAFGALLILAGVLASELRARSA